MTKPVNHLLHDDDNTVESSHGSYYGCGATWFPFGASIVKTDKASFFEWELHFAGGHPGSLGRGVAESWSEACGSIRALQQELLVRLKRQLA